MKKERTPHKLNNKGFSLIELIIVIAIMVALVAVMGPQYIKYVSRSHDAVVTQAAEDVLAFVKSEFANGTLTGKGGIRVGAKVVDNKKIIGVDFVKSQDNTENTIVYTDGVGETDIDRFRYNCGVDNTKAVKSDLVYYIYIDNTISSHPTLEYITVEEDIG